LRPSTHRALSHERLVSSNASDVQTANMPRQASALDISVETTNIRVTFDGTDPSAASAPSLVFPYGQVPVFRPVGPGTTIKFCSTAGTPAVLQILYYT
jgi:hypothetical protein